MATKKTAKTANKLQQAPTGYTVPGIDVKDGHQVAAVLQDRLNALNDLALTLKHVHWNVVGPHFIAVHEMIDPQVEQVRAAVDETAERIATLGASPKGTPGEIVANRSWDDYDLSRATTNEHLGALDVVYDGVIADHRQAVEKVGDVDPVTEDMLIGQIGGLELFQWFVRAHLESTDGTLATGAAATETAAAGKASRSAKRAG